MDIISLGHSSFKMSFKTATVVTDPFEPSFTGLKFPKTSCDIATVSHSHDDHNAVGLLDDTKKVVDRPGEYEIMGISIFGFQTFHDAQNGELRGKNTIFLFEAEDLRILHLGDLGHPLSGSMISDIGDIDILFVPVGGYYTIDAGVALDLVKALSPKIVIPMHFKQIGLKEEIASNLVSADEFINASGLPVEKLNKITIKSKTALPQDSKVYLFEK